MAGGGKCTSFMQSVVVLGVQCLAAVAPVGGRGYCPSSLERSLPIVGAWVLGRLSTTTTPHHIQQTYNNWTFENKNSMRCRRREHLLSASLPQSPQSTSHRIITNHH
ncbi:uncharacterized protein B0I36DRAFT_106941 [Microdochium trichocladiopsis]|uniref:Secreted protein n=1 Tax=Microdochium trichocladiopsis TaxID=1682393 RepID=A0A9P8YBG9_9PEZI|nr:uncharacterized protein B0I36DRAFT_106941 [Microdochium trichocladiopsis]KAH7033269.1 hypothetical protein B0I36DRAFT_106941 [Microdochium trichocladiopsis]